MDALLAIESRPSLGNWRDQFQAGSAPVSTSPDQSASADRSEKCQSSRLRHRRNEFERIEIGHARSQIGHQAGRNVDDAQMRGTAHRGAGGEIPDQRTAVEFHRAHDVGAIVALVRDVGFEDRQLQLL